jgi:hypothetical protein
VDILDPGHQYALRSLDSESDETVTLTFVKREGPGYPGNQGHHSGTTTQEVLRALIDRGEYVNRQVPCAETEAATELLRSALLLLELRAARRHGRFLDMPSVDRAVYAQCCSKCNHVGCDGNCH